MMAQAEASDYQLDAYANKNEIPDQVRNDIIGKSPSTYAKASADKPHP